MIYFLPIIGRDRSMLALSNALPDDKIIFEKENPRGYACCCQRLLNKSYSVTASLSLGRTACLIVLKMLPKMEFDIVLQVKSSVPYRSLSHLIRKYLFYYRKYTLKRSVMRASLPFQDSCSEQISVHDSSNKAHHAVEASYHKL